MKLSKIVLLLNLILSVFACLQIVSAQAKNNPQNITDYYLLLPADKLPVLESVRSRRSIIKTEDTKNGYLRLEGAWEGWAELALFRKSNRDAIIALEEVGCGPECSGTLQFLIYKNGRWTDVTAQVMPEIGDEDILAAYNRIKTRSDEARSLDDLPPVYWQLPQKGTILKLVLGSAGGASDGKTLINFNWNGNRFIRAGK